MPDRQFYEPEGGEALDSNNDVYDVTQWRKDAQTEQLDQGTTLDGIETEALDQGTTLDAIEAEQLDQGTTLDNIQSGQESERQTRNSQEHVRVYDPEANATLKEILAELRNMNRHLEIITELEVNDWD